jgi:iron complex transport system substrate-binding protein
MTTTRARRAFLAVLVTLALLALAACGSDGGGDRDTADAPTSSTPEDAAFPVTIEHKFGATTITEEPQRVVSLGYQEHDTILALGVQPVAVRYWYGPEDDAIRTWAEDEATGPAPEILNMPELNVEAVAALRPDLILGLYSGITEEEYEKLSVIAPTVAQSDEYVDYGVPWQDMTITAGTALGRLDRAEQLVADLEARFAAVREAHPEWEGKQVVVATHGADKLGFFASDDPRSRFFRSLGFEVPARFDELAGDLFYGDISFEEAELLDHDLLVWDQLAFTQGGRATVEANPVVQQLAVMREGRAVFLTGDVEDGFGWNTVLSLAFVLDALVPELERATT